MMPCQNNGLCQTNDLFQNTSITPSVCGSSLPISKLSEYLQGDSTNLLLVQSAVDAALVTLAKDVTYREQLGN